jgi:hypothetical protein
MEGKKVELQGLMTWGGLFDPGARSSYLIDGELGGRAGCSFSAVGPLTWQMLSIYKPGT